MKSALYQTFKPERPKVWINLDLRFENFEQTYESSADSNDFEPILKRWTKIHKRTFKFGSGKPHRRMNIQIRNLLYKQWAHLELAHKEIINENEVCLLLRASTKTEESEREREKAPVFELFFFT